MSMLDRPFVPNAVTIVVQSLEAAAVPIVPYLQNDSVAHRRKGAAVYGYNIPRTKGNGQIHIIVG
jgi:hypothetical protein